jgi:hypothetical protein
MRSADFVMAAVLTAALSGTAIAQTATPQPTATPASSSSSAAQTPTSPIVAGPTRSHWLASVFAGSNFSTSREDVDIDSGASFDFGGQLGYLWRGIAGVEALADFAPSMDVSTLAFANNPSVNSYMLNAIGAVPLGAEGQIQPYLSGGFGAVQIAADVLQLAGQDSIRSSQSQMGTNIGGGLMGFGGNFGFRADVRHYHAGSEENLSATTPADVVTEALLSGLSFWRANAGIAFRW